MKVASKGIILSLFDYSGNWPRFFKEDGYTVIQVDLPRRVYGVLAAPPCTDFSSSGAQYWPIKDKDGRTERSLKLVFAALRIIDSVKPMFWMMENPVGRLRRWIGAPNCYVHPHEYAGYAPHPDTDRYTKKTGLWGSFELPPKRSLLPIRTCNQGSWIQALGGSSERTKELRSITPLGLAYATWLANRVEALGALPRAA